MAHVKHTFTRTENIQHFNTLAKLLAGRKLRMDEHGNRTREVYAGEFQLVGESRETNGTGLFDVTVVTFKHGASRNCVHLVRLTDRERVGGDVKLRTLVDWTLNVPVMGRAFFRGWFGADYDAEDYAAWLKGVRDWSSLHDYHELERTFTNFTPSDWRECFDSHMDQDDALMRACELLYQSLSNGGKLPVAKASGASWEQWLACVDAKLNTVGLPLRRDIREFDLEDWRNWWARDEDVHYVVGEMVQAANESHSLHQRAPLGGDQ